MGSKSRKAHHYLGADIGGTKILTGLLNKNFQVLSDHKVRLDAQKGEKHFLQTLFHSLEEVMKVRKISKKQIRAIGLGCPGMIDQKKGIVKLSPNISFLKDYSLAKKIQKKWNVPVVLENDANAGLYGEFRLGSAKGYEHVAGIFLGTGVGGAFILNGKLYSGTEGGAGEIGHTFLQLPSFLNETRYATLESLTGRLVMAAEAGTLIMKQQSPHLFKTVGYDIKQIKSKSLAKSIRAGDLALRKLIEDKARIVGIAMANLVNLLNLELIVLGGGVIEAMGNIIVPVAKKTMQEYALGPLVKSVKVVPAKLKDYSVLLGAAKLAAERTDR